MTKTEFAKAFAAVVVGFGTSGLVKQIIKNNVNPDSVSDKAAVLIGSYVLGAMAADAAKDWTDARIDELIAQWTKLVKKNDIV
jgi:hypothetical protein